MDREILFKGKRIDNSEWIEGYYTELPVGSLAATIFSNDDEIVCEDTASYIIKVFARQHSNYSNSTPLQVMECEKYKVIPKTIGLYTGLTDKNGEKIFEGDILRFTRGGNEYIGKVVYEQRICGLDLWYNKVVGAYGEKATFRVNLTEPTKLEVIGNIYDNPELLEVE